MAADDPLLPLGRPAERLPGRGPRGPEPRPSAASMVKGCFCWWVEDSVVVLGGASGGVDPEKYCMSPTR